MGRTKRRTGRFRKKRSIRAFRNAESPHVTVVIPAQNERRTIARVIREAYMAHPLTEVIVVANGSTDGTEHIARRCGARVILYATPLGHDVGRGIGAMEAKGEVIVFTDADIVIPAAQLRVLIRAVEQGVDVALNQYLGPTDIREVHSVVIAKHVLNISLQRPELKGTSMTTIPHALSRAAVQTIGAAQLAVPPKAHAAAIAAGLNVQAVHHIDVGKRNPRRRRTHGKDPLEFLIVGDHLEAISALLARDARGGRTDLNRRRELVR